MYGVDVYSTASRQLSLFIFSV